MKHIIREVAPDCEDLSYYFDNDGLTGKGGNYCYNLFIISNDGFNRFHGFNIDEYKRVMEQAEWLILPVAVAKLCRKIVKERS